jgi:hypothetical protein
VFGGGFVGAALGIEAGVGQHKPLNRTAMKEMLVDDLLHIFYVDEAVPDGVWIDHDDRPVLALVEAAKLVCPDFSLQAGFLDGVLERSLQLFAAFAAAAWPGGVFFPLIRAEEEMMLKLRHGNLSFVCRVVVRCTGVSETI